MNNMDKRNLKYYLRWSNGYQQEGQPYIPYQFYLENLETNEIINIENEEAINFIKEKTTNGFRNTNELFENHIKLFKILNIKDGLKNQKKDTNLNIRINGELLKKLKNKSKEENRTLSNLIETIIKDYLKR